VIIKLLSVDPQNYDDAPLEGIRRLLERFTGKELPRGQPLDTSDIGLCSACVGYPGEGGGVLIGWTQNRYVWEQRWLQMRCLSGRGRNARSLPRRGLGIAWSSVRLRSL